MPQLDLSMFPSQVLWILLFFALQCLFFVKIVPIFKNLAQLRRDQVSQKLEAAQSQMLQAQKLKDEYEEKLAQVRKDSAEKISGAVAEFQSITDRKISNLDKKLLEEFKAHQAETAKITKKLEKDLDELALLTAAELIKKISLKNASKRDLAKYIN